MKIPDDFVPVTLDEAVKCLLQSASDDDKIAILRHTSVSSHEHFGLGGKIRNSWELYDKESRMVRWFKSEYGIDHADDISTIILACLWNDVRGEPRVDKSMARDYVEKWKQTNRDI
jgi:hypothetical protein